MKALKSKEIIRRLKIHIDGMRMLEKGYEDGAQECELRRQAVQTERIKLQNVLDVIMGEIPF